MREDSFYSIYRHPRGHLTAVKAGWSWPAFLYGVFWALYGRHWRVAGGCIALLLTWALLESQRVGFRFWFSSIAFMMSIALGMTGNELRRRQLQHMGYKKIRDYVNADTVKGALHAFQIAQEARKENRRNRRRAANSEKPTRSS